MSYRADTRVLRVDRDTPEREHIAAAAAAIREGGLVAFPTETVYGLGANATDASAVSRIFAAKERPTTDPLIVHLASLEQLDNVVVAVPTLAHTLAAHFWPGALTLVLRRAAVIPPSVAAGGDTVAVRVPAHPVARALLDASGLPIAAPSANRFSRPSPTTAAHVYADLNGRVDVILDGGKADLGVESTILDLTQAVPVILRPGGIPLEALRPFVPDLRYTPRYLDADQTAAAPGMLLRHYAPDAEVWLYTGADDALVYAALAADARSLIAAGRQTGILAYSEDAPLDGAHTVVLGSRADDAAVGRTLFAALRTLEERGVAVILARGIPEQGLGAAIWDRLVRAAEGRIIRIG